MFFSQVYQRVKDTFGTVDTFEYGPLEVKTIKNDKYIWHGQFKTGTDVLHGRNCEIYNHEEILDAFFKNNQLNGPALYIKPDGTYVISQYENDKEVSNQWFRADGTE